VAKRSAVVRRKGFVDDPARLREMVRAALSVAHGPAGNPDIFV
jgi:hypothetical protein